MKLIALGDKINKWWDDREDRKIERQIARKWLAVHMTDFNKQPDILYDGKRRSLRDRDDGVREGGHSIMKNDSNKLFTLPDDVVTTCEDRCERCVTE